MRCVQPVQPKNIAIYFEPQSLIQRWMIRVHLAQVDTLTRSICCIRFPAIVFVAMCIPWFFLPRLSELILFFCSISFKWFVFQRRCKRKKNQTALTFPLNARRNASWLWLERVVCHSWKWWRKKACLKPFQSTSKATQIKLSPQWLWDELWMIGDVEVPQRQPATKNAAVRNIILEFEWIFTRHWCRFFCFVPS